MGAFWTMTDFDGCGYINNCKGDTILKTVDHDSAIELCDELNRNHAIVTNYRPEVSSVMKKILTGKRIIKE